MKKFIHFLLIVAIIISLSFSAAIAADSAVLFEKNFDKDAVGSLAGDKDGFTVQKRSEGNMMGVVDKEFPDAASVNSYLFASYGLVAKTGGKIAYEFDYKSNPENNVGLLMYFNGSDSDDTKSFPYVTIMVKSNELSCVIGGVSGSPVKLENSDKEFVKIKLEIDLDAHTYDVYVNGTKKGTAWPFRDNKNFPSAYSGEAPITGPVILKNITFMCPGIQGDGPFKSKFTFDNILVTAIDGKVDDGKATPAPVITPAPVANGESTLPSYLNVEHSLRNNIKGCISLFLGQPMAMIGSDYFPIDKNNPYIRPFTANDRTLVPLRFISESFGADVKWEEATEKITVTLGSNTVLMFVGKNEYTVSGQTKTMDTTPVVMNDRTFIPLRAMSESLNKKVFWDDRGLIILSDNENPIKDSYELDILCQKMINANEPGSYAPYSSVFLSNRWYRAKTGDSSGDAGTHEILKKFMATQDKWSYISDKNQIGNIVNLGISFQGALSTTLGTKGADGTVPGGTVTLEGKPIIAPWMTWGAPWGCFNSEGNYQIVIETARKSIEAGATEFQHDDASGNYAVTIFNTGCFCDECMTKFTKYLEEFCSAERLKELEITNIKSFNYKTYLSGKGITTDTGYQSAKAKLPINTEFVNFAHYSNKQYFDRLREDLAKIAGKKVNLSVNDYPFMLYDLQLSKQQGREKADYGQCEHHEDAFSLDNIITGARMNSAVGSPLIISPVMAMMNDDIARLGIAGAYAFGQYMLVPWDIYLSGVLPRYFGKIEAYSDMYQFIREYKHLFNGYEIDARVGVVSDFADFTATDTPKYKSFVSSLFKSGVQYKALPVSYTEGYPKYSITPEMLKGLDCIIAYSDMEKLSEADRKVILDSGIKVVTKDEANEQFINANLSAKAIAGSGENLYTVIRNNNGNAAVHVINEKDSTESRDITVTVNKKYINATNAYVFVPGKNPVKVNSVDNGDTVTVKFDKMKEWAIISFTNDLKALGAEFALSENYTGFAVGNPAMWGSAVENEGKLTLKSKGLGINVNAVGDQSSQDSVTMVYKHIEDSVFTDYTITSDFENISGSQAGLQLRQSAASNAPFIGVRVENGKAYMDIREAYNGAVASKEIGAYTAANGKFTIDKKGKSVTVSVSGSQSAQGTADFLIPFAIAGVFNASKDYKNEAAATFNGINISTAPVSFTKSSFGDITLEDTKEKAKYDTTFKVALKVKINNSVFNATPSIVKFSSSDTSVARVDENGIIYSVKAGETEIKAIITVGGEAIEKSFKLSVLSELLIFEETLEGVPIGTKVGDLETFGKKWQSTVITEGKAEVVARPGGDGKCIQIAVMDAATSVDIMYNLPDIKGDFTIEFDYMTNFKGIENIGSDVLYVMGGAMGISTFCHAEGFAWFDNKDMHTVAKHENNKWYRMRFDINLKLKSMDWYIDGVCVVKGAAFRNPIDRASQISFGTQTNKINTEIFIDNIKFLDK